MNTRLLRFFAPLLLALCCSTASAKDLTDLAPEADALANALKPAAPIKGGQEKALLLSRAAGVMQAEKECFSAYVLTKKSLAFGATADQAAWLSLARQAACAQKWVDASQAAWLALQQTKEKDKDGRANALFVLADSLERRPSNDGDWKPAALAAWDELLKIRDSDEVRGRAGKLREVVNQATQLRITDVQSKAEANAPSICLQFNTDLPPAGDLHYEDYVRFEPAFTPVFTVEGSNLCAAGAAYNTTYSVLVRNGLTAENRALAQDQRMEVDTGHRKPAMWFDASAYVLQQSRKSGVPLYSVNLRKAHFDLLRVGERNLLSTFVRDRFRAQIDGYEIGQVADTLGERVWEGDADLTGKQDEVTLTPLGIPDEWLATPGLYLLTARDAMQSPDSWEQRATQWLVVSDIGLTSFRADDGLTLIARSLATGKPLAGVEMVLYARNNDPLGQGVTDAEGRVSFAPGLLRGKGGKEAVQVTALSATSGFTFLLLTQPAFDLSDRGVGGRPSPGPLDGFIYTERGVYRPGESVNPVALLRDDRGQAVTDLPLKLRLLNPDKEPVMERVLQPSVAGSYTSKIDIAQSARTGRWGIELMADDRAQPVGRTEFLVEPIVPPRIEVNLDAEGALVPGRELAANVDARYLYGAPAMERPVVAELFLEADPKPFPEFGEFNFGRVDEKVETTRIELPEAATDAEGKAQLSLILEQPPTAGQPLRGKLRVEVADVDGRAVPADLLLPVRHLPYYIGVQPQFRDNRTAQEAEAGFKVVVLDPQGRPRSHAEVTWRLLAEDWTYQWFQNSEGAWEFERVMKESLVAKGSLQVQGQAPAELRAPVGQGNFRIELFGQEKAFATSYRFVAGEQVEGEAGVPDTVRVELDKGLYAAGETAKLTLNSPFAGEASLVLAGNRIHEVTHFTLAQKEHDLEIPVEGEWGAGTYALVTVYRPGSAEGGARRAVGVIWLGLDSKPHKLELAVDAPERIRPRQSLPVTLRVSGAKPGEPVGVTLATVDEGVLNMTEFVTPSPLAYLFGKRGLGAEMRDIYGRLIQDSDQAPLWLRSGGDSAGRRGAPQADVEIVSRFSGILTPDAQGYVRVPLEIPDFNGKVRLMAVAWSPDKVGSVERAMVVNDPVVVSPSLPRFLALGDQSELNLLLQNMDGPAGEYRLHLTASGALELAGAAEQPVSLKPGDQKGLRLPIQAKDLGEGRLQLELTGPEGFRYLRNLKIGVRGKFLPRIERRYQRIEPGAELVLNPALFEGMHLPTASLAANLGSAPGIDVKGLLEQLSKYPYGCLEQTVSQALPLLYYPQLAEKWGLAQDPGLRPRLETAIERIVGKQRSDGGFSLWSGDDQSEPWLDAFVMDFLVRAKKAGYKVPDYFYDKGLRNLREQVTGNSYEPDGKTIAGLAYAHLVLAGAGQGRVEDARYLADTRAQLLPSPLAASQLGAALALQGELERARKLFSQAAAMPTRQQTSVDYGSLLRDLAAMATLLEESGLGLGDQGALVDRLVTLVQEQQWYSTQEEAWLVMAARALGGGKTPMQYAIDGAAQEAATHRTLGLDGAAIQKGMTVRNTGDQPIWIALTLEGTPLKESAPAANHFKLKRSWFSLDGQPADPGSVEQGQRLMVLLEGELLDKEEHRTLVMDLLPAGFEIENPRLAGASATTDFGWLPELTPARYSEALDDRFVTALDLSYVPDEKGKVHFRAAYLARAVTPGSYYWPPAEVEDIYQPQWRGSTVGSGVEIGLSGQIP